MKTFLFVYLAVISNSIFPCFQMTCVDNLGLVLGNKNYSHTCETSDYCIHTVFHEKAQIIEHAETGKHIISGEIRTCGHNKATASELKYCTQGKTGCTLLTNTWLGPYVYTRSVPGQFMSVCCCNGTMCNNRKATLCNNKSEMTMVLANGRAVEQHSNFTCATYHQYCLKTKIYHIIIKTITGSDMKVGIKGSYTGCAPFDSEYMKICEKMEIEEHGAKYCKVYDEIKGMEFGNQTLLKGYMNVCCCKGDYCI